MPGQNRAITRQVDRRLKLRNLPFLFSATHPPEDVTTVRGAPIVLKPERPQEIVAAVAKLFVAEGARVANVKPQALRHGRQQTMM
jgi:hypothetical protein